MPRVKKRNSIILEKMKLQIELESLAIERKKLRFEWLKVLSIIVPLVGSLFLIYTNMKIQQKNEEANFKLKIAEIISNETDPDAALGKIFFLQAVFPDLLKENTFRTINPDHFSKEEEDIIFNQRRDFLQLLFSNWEQKNEFVDAWMIAFPNDTLAQQLGNY